MKSVSKKFKAELSKKEAALKAEKRQQEELRAKEQAAALKSHKKYVRDFLKEATQTLDEKISEAFNQIADSDAKAEPVIKYYDFSTSLDMSDIVKMKAYKDFKRACEDRDIAFGLNIETVEVGTILCEETRKEERLKLRVYPALSSYEKPSCRR